MDADSIRPLERVASGCSGFPSAPPTLAPAWS
jgi:hypothetical protein